MESVTLHGVAVVLICCCVSGTTSSVRLSLCPADPVFLRNNECVHFVLIQIEEFRVMGQNLVEAD